MLFRGDMTDLPFWIGSILVALTFHEWGHAIMAKWFGDRTPEQLGRLTLNPLAHLDPFGTLAILLIGFGWAKPVAINPANFRSSWGELWVAAAGPLVNILLACLAGVLWHLNIASAFGSENEWIVTRFLQVLIFLNLALAFFNLIPLGPLDGNHILARLLPLRASMRFRDWNLQYGGLFLMAIIVADLLMGTRILVTIVGAPVILFSHYVLQVA